MNTDIEKLLDELINATVATWLAHLAYHNHPEIANNIKAQEATRRMFAIKKSILDVISERKDLE